MNKPKILYRAGENKRQRIRIFDQEGEAVAVQAATWELHANNGDALIERGSCTVIDGNTLSFLLGIDAPGYYHLVVTYLVGPEIYKTEAEVTCNDCGH